MGQFQPEIYSIIPKMLFVLASALVVFVFLVSHRKGGRGPKKVENIPKIKAYYLLTIILAVGYDVFGLIRSSETIDFIQAAFVATYLLAFLGIAKNELWGFGVAASLGGFVLFGFLSVFGGYSKDFLQYTYMFVSLTHLVLYFTINKKIQSSSKQSSEQNRF